MTNKGYITIKENQVHEYIVDAKLVNGNLWLTQNEIARLFNVYANTIGNHLRSIFKSGLLREEDVSRKHSFEHNGHPCETTLYNLKALIFISYRVSSFEAEAFRQWVLNALCEYLKEEKSKPEVWIVYNLPSNLPFASYLN